MNAQLDLWKSKGVYGHFKKLSSSLIPPWLDLDEAVQAPLARIVGASPSEVVAMQTLSANLHLLLSSFYRPTSTRYKILLEEKSFPSDHFVIESQLRHHHIDSHDGMVLLHPPSPESPCLPTEYILETIDTHAPSIAVVLLPGIQFYTGQLFDMKRITAHAHSKGILVGWDLAHAVGNVPLSLHDWNVDFAAWCNYKYMNSGPGAIGSLFVHSRHTDAVHAPQTNSESAQPKDASSNNNRRPHLQGWWGSTKASRFTMDNKFDAIPGAAGFQVSNPSALDLSALLGSLSIFEKTTIDELRAKSVRLTAYMEALLLETPLHNKTGRQPVTMHSLPYTIITPQDSEQRGAQLSVRLDAGVLDFVLQRLADEHVVVDERKPDVVRVAPAPLYNNFQDCWRFAQVFRQACIEGITHHQASHKSSM